MAFGYSPRIITNGLVLYLDAANTRSYPGSGTTWSDLSRSGNNGTLTNGPTFNSANLGSIVFDGSDDYVSAPSSSTLNQMTGLTISAWVNKKTKNIKVVGKWKNPGGLCYILREVAGTLQFFTFTSSQIGGNIGINPTPGWKLYTATWDGQTMRAYLNTTISTTTYSQTGTISGNTSNLIIGAEYDTLDNSDANIALVQVYNRALSSQEITQNYNATKGRFGL